MHSPTHQSHLPDFKYLGIAFQLGIAMNLGFVVVEVIFGLVFGSMSLLADAGHNLSDVIGLLLAYAGFRLATLKPSKRFTYGLGSTTILASTLNGAILLIGVGAIVWESIGRLRSPEIVHGSGIIVVAAVGVVINFLTAALFLRGRKRDLNVKGAFLHMLADGIVSLGVVVAGFLILWTKWTWIDPVVGLLIAAVILYTTWSLFRDSLVLLTHGVPVGIDVNEIQTYLSELPGVESVHDLHVWALSTTKTAMTAHLVKVDLDNSDELLTTIERDMHQQHRIDHCTIQIESASKESSCRLAPVDEV